MKNDIIISKVKLEREIRKYHPNSQKIIRHFLKELLKWKKIK